MLSSFGTVQCIQYMSNNLSKEMYGMSHSSPREDEGCCVICSVVAAELFGMRQLQEIPVMLLLDCTS